MNCRHCNTPLTNEFINLVNQPPSNSFLTSAQLNEPETYFPLRLFVCPKCFLVQIDEYKSSQEIFSAEYVYYSSFSSSWVDHAHRYVDMICDRLDLTSDSFVVELASNDGYLLQFMVEKGIPSLGVEPSTATADAGREKGVDSINEFFGYELATRMAEHGPKADLLLGNNVLAHVPDINDFVSGMKTLLTETGVVTMEFPHLLQLVTHNQFDTIYHEHFSYLSLTTVNRIFAKQGLVVFDVEDLPTHGGSLRVFARHAENNALPIAASVTAMLDTEKDMGMTSLPFYQNFQASADTVKLGMLQFLLDQKKAGKHVAAYGAAAKGNTLLNYCGVKSDLVSFAVDASPHKQGLYMPGSHIPVLAPQALKEHKPDFVIILPWNLKDEISTQHSYIQEWGGRFVVPIPELTVL